VVFHLAAQALVRAGYREPVDTFATNVMGTVHVLEALRGLDSVRVAVMVTTDKVYRNREWVHAYREVDELGGVDPYAASKSASELAVESYRQSFLAKQGVRVASARAGNVVGGGDWSEDRLIPDTVRAWSRNEPLELRNPRATRPWQHVLEPLAGYLVLAQRLWQDAELVGAWNFAPSTEVAAEVASVVQAAAACWPGAKVRLAAGDPGVPEAAWLALDGAKARLRLGVRPVWSLTETVQRTIHWYRAHREGGDARSLCEADLRAFEAAAT
jgi:CDP-glucose 4,6-dehydratase